MVVLVEALSYKPEGRRFDFGSGHCISLINPSNHNMALRSTHSITKVPRIFLLVWGGQRNGFESPTEYDLCCNVLIIPYLCNF
jgi:hypothetical protein